MKKQTKEKPVWTSSTPYKVGDIIPIKGKIGNLTGQIRILTAGSNKKANLMLDGTKAQPRAKLKKP